MVVSRHGKAQCSCAHIDLSCLHICYTRSNGVRVPATVVGMAGDGLIHLEYYQDALTVVNRQCKMESSCVFLRVATNALFMAFPVVHDVCYVKGR